MSTNRIVGIDPGSEVSAVVVYLPDDQRVMSARHSIENEFVLEHLIPSFANTRIAIEMIESFGMQVGRSVFETCVWIGRFYQQAERCERIYRGDVKLHICGTRTAKDANIRAALLDRWYPGTGGGATPQVGTQDQPGQLYGVAKDSWQALAVAITAAEQGVFK